jgi:hypothetical protein
MHWYGEDLDLKVKLPSSLPQYVAEADVQKLLARINAKKNA